MHCHRYCGQDILWSQGNKVKENVIFQDNKSTLILEKNGKASSSKRTKHIMVRYFFVKDKIEKGEVAVKYCPTEKMRSDVLTKPLQGKKIRKMRSMLMNCLEDYYEIAGDTLYPGSKQKSSHDKHQQKMMPKSTRLNMPSQECVGVPRLKHKAVSNVTDTHYLLHNVSNRQTKKVSFGPISIILVKKARQSEEKQDAILFH